MTSFFKSGMVYNVENVKATVDELAILAIDGADLGVCNFDVVSAHPTILR